MGSFSFSTKAENLKRLRPLIKKGTILEQVCFAAVEWQTSPDTIWEEICRLHWQETLLIVRSSAQCEDCFEQSHAGGFLSVANVCGKEALYHAIERVLLSYGQHNPQDQIFIQPQLQSVSMAGVAFTADINTFAPYYIVNYDCSGSTSQVTGGGNVTAATYIQFKDSPASPREERLSQIIDVCRECEVLTGSTCLDIEFAFANNGELFILQVRPIATKRSHTEHRAVNLKQVLDKLHKKIIKLCARHPNLLGERSVFGVMPDWNPAEIIGTKPRPLALSLYRELITDNIWAYQRDNYGYRNLRSHPLLISFLGAPYIDVRVSFNSFIPQRLPDSIAEKLATYYIDQLISSPHHHDKVEFEIVHSCYYLNLPEKLEQLQQFGFNKNELKRIEFSLLDITNRIIAPENGLYKEDLKKIEKLPGRFQQIHDSALSLVDKIYWWTEDCKRYGTLPFAGIARAAFIAVQFLRSFVEIQIISQREYDLFLNSLNTVSRRMNKALQQLRNGEIAQEEFLVDYGHLRPGTYDILSKRYDDCFEEYFPPDSHIFSSANVTGTKKWEDFCFSPEQFSEIDHLLRENGITIGAARLMTFIKEAIEGREYAKFVFTKSLSEILRSIDTLGTAHGISSEDLSFLNIQSVLNLYASLDQRDISATFNDCISRNKETYEYTKSLKLPSLLVSPNDIYSFFLEKDEPNFITLNQIQAEIFSGEDLINTDLKGKIVFIPSADPGYDFLFAKGITGLITQYGGANSHMAIRCAEQGLPAVIGAGEKKFKDWSKANVLLLDCAAKQAQVIS